MSHLLVNSDFGKYIKNMNYIVLQQVPENLIEKPVLFLQINLFRLISLVD